MWRFAEGRRGKIVLVSVMFVVANVIWAFEPLAVGLMLNAIQAAGLTYQTLYLALGLLGLLLAIDVGGWFFHGIARYIENNTSFAVRANYKNHLLKGVLALPLEWHSDHHSGDTIDKIEKGSAGLSGFAENTFQIIQATVTFVVAVGTLLYFDFIATLAVLAFAIPAFFILAAFDAYLVKGYKRVAGMENETSAKVFDTLSNVTTIIILRVEALVLTAINGAIEKPKTQFRANSRANEWKWFISSLMGRFASMGVVAVYLIHQLALGSVLVGTIYILYGYVDRIRNTLWQFAAVYNDIIRWRSNVANSEDLSKDFREPPVRERALPRDWKELQIQNLSFSYDGAKGERLHLSDVTLTVKKGERIALIGESGGGKSTFLKLLRDLYHPKTLELRTDGVSVAGGFTGIENSISLVPQDPEIFTTTIRENITLGVGYPESHIQVFTDMAEFTGIAERLPKKLESSIVEKGVNLSGGEKQRLALSRGLLASEHKDIVLLDEPTSSVDFGNELKIYENIFESFPGKTIISSIHRLHLLPLFDTVYLFSGGRVIARGSFAELKEASAEFKVLWKRYIASRDAERG